MDLILLFFGAFFGFSVGWCLIKQDTKEEAVKIYTELLERLSNLDLTLHQSTVEGVPMWRVHSQSEKRAWYDLTIEGALLKAEKYFLNKDLEDKNS